MKPQQGFAEPTEFNYSKDNSRKTILKPTSGNDHEILEFKTMNIVFKFQQKLGRTNCFVLVVLQPM